MVSPVWTHIRVKTEYKHPHGYPTQCQAWVPVANRAEREWCGFYWCHAWMSHSKFLDPAAGLPPSEYYKSQKAIPQLQLLPHFWLHTNTEGADSVILLLLAYALPTTASCLQWIWANTALRDKSWHHRGVLQFLQLPLPMQNPSLHHCLQIGHMLQDPHKFWDCQYQRPLLVVALASTAPEETFITWLEPQATIPLFHGPWKQCSDSAKVCTVPKVINYSWRNQKRLHYGAHLEAKSMLPTNLPKTLSGASHVGGVLPHRTI